MQSKNSEAKIRREADKIISLLELIVPPSVLIGTVIGVTAAVVIGKFFPEHDLSFLQALPAVGGFLVGIVLDLGGKSRSEE